MAFKISSTLPAYVLLGPLVVEPNTEPRDDFAAHGVERHGGLNSAVQLIIGFPQGGTMNTCPIILC
jgi:hypothetical protein